MCCATRVQSQIDRLSSGLASAVADSDSASGSSGSTSSGSGGGQLAVLSRPLCVEVRPGTLRALAALLGEAGAGYFDAAACADAEFAQRMHAVVAALRVLKAHLRQLVTLGRPNLEMSLNHHP